MKEEWLRIERIEYSNDRMGNGYVYDEKVDGKLNGIRPFGRYSRNRNSRGDDIEIDDDVEILRKIWIILIVMIMKIEKKLCCYNFLLCVYFLLLRAFSDVTACFSFISFL